MLQIRLDSDSIRASVARLEIFNVGDEPVLLPKVHVGFNRFRVLSGDYFEFDDDVRYLGNEAAQELDPTEAIELLPHHSHLISTVDLATHYLLPESASVRARYNHGGYVSNWATFSA